MRASNLAGLAAAMVFASGWAGDARAVTPNSQYSTTFQINPAHSGTITFTSAFAPPLRTVWSITFGGAVSYPIVANGRVYVSVSNSPAGTPLLVAIDLTTGKILWQKATSIGYLAYDAGRLFFTDFSGPLTAFAAKTGAVLWSAQLPYESFFNFIPVAAKGSVYAGGDESGTKLYQVNEVTGQVGWIAGLAAGGQGATIGGGQVYFSIPCDVPAFAELTGSLVWNYNTGCDGGGGQIDAYYHGRVYDPYNRVVLDATTGAIVGSLSGALPAFYGARSFTATSSGVLAENLKTGNLAWQWAAMDTLIGLPVVVNGTVFVASKAGNIYALDGTTGALLQTLTPGVGGNTISYDTIAGLGAGQGYLVAPTGNVLSAFAP